MISRSIGSCVSKVQRRTSEITEIVPHSARFLLQWVTYQAAIKLQAHNTNMTPYLLDELLIVLRVNDVMALRGCLDLCLEELKRSSY
jgi:hypothetical protein